jgi:predicted nucleic acid-binding protein
VEIVIVVADTSPLNYLVTIDEIDILPMLFGEVLIPSAVLRELQHERTSLKVRTWSQNLPSWVVVKTVDPRMPIEGSLLSLGLGEREAIALALQLNVGAVIIDDFEGRVEATKRLLKVNGTLGILEQAAKAGHTNFRQALAKLEQTKFRMSSEVRDAFLSRNP